MDKLERMYAKKAVVWLLNPHTGDIKPLYAGKVERTMREVCGWIEVDDPHAGDVVLPPEQLGKQWPEDVEK